MSSARAVTTAATRRQLNARQAETVSRLVAAARDEVRDVGFADMTVRSVAARAEVAAATAYTYFSSKNHLVAEIFWRALADRPRVTSRKGAGYGRVVEVFHDLADFVANDPELSAAVTFALLSEEPDVRHLRVLIGTEINERIAAALGDKPEPEIMDALSLAWSGALLQVGMGHARAEDLGDRLARVARLIMRG
jgi:TetR/AcrR family transcriptional regulator, cholesterol catabolism regulator